MHDIITSWRFVTAVTIRMRSCTDISAQFSKHAVARLRVCETTSADSLYFRFAQILCFIIRCGYRSPFVCNFW